MKTMKVIINGTKYEVLQEHLLTDMRYVADVKCLGPGEPVLTREFAREEFSDEEWEALKNWTPNG